LHRHGPGIANDMVIGDDKARRIDDEARARRAATPGGFAALRTTLGMAERQIAALPAALPAALSATLPAAGTDMVAGAWPDSITPAAAPVPASSTAAMPSWNLERFSTGMQALLKQNGWTSF